MFIIDFAYNAYAGRVKRRKKAFEMTTICIFPQKIVDSEKIKIK